MRRGLRPYLSDKDPIVGDEMNAASDVMPVLIPIDWIKVLISITRKYGRFAQITITNVDKYLGQERESE